MSLRKPSYVSATTGSEKKSAPRLLVPGACLFRTCHSMYASRTTPTECVLVMSTGPSRKPDSSIQVVPVISPFPFCEYQPANEESTDCLPRGQIAVTPVRTGPCPTISLPCPEMSVLLPTSTPGTSVIAFHLAGVPEKGTPR